MAKLLSNGVDGLCIMVQLGTGPQLSAPNHRGRAHGWQTHEVPHVGSNYHYHQQCMHRFNIKQDFTVGDFLHLPVKCGHLTYTTKQKPKSHDQIYQALSNIGMHLRCAVHELNDLTSIQYVQVGLYS